MKLLALVFLAVVLIPAALVIGNLFLTAPTTEGSGSSPGAALSVGARTPVEPFDTELATPRPSSDRNVVAPQAGVVDDTRVADVAKRPAAGTTRPGFIDQSRRAANAEKLIRDSTLARARRLAEQVDLDTKSEKVLADLLVEQRRRFRRLQARIATLPRGNRDHALREGHKGLQVWYMSRLSANFDAKTVEKLRKSYVVTADAAALTGDKK